MTNRNLFRKHTGRPVLAHHKGRATKSYKEAKNVKLSSILHEPSTGTWNGCCGENSSHQDSSTVLVAKRPINETHKNSSSNWTYVRSPHLLLAKSKRKTDFWQERSDGEPNEKGGEEAKPREVEGAHVGALKGSELDFGCLVVLVGIDINVISLIFLDYGLRSSWNSDITTRSKNMRMAKGDEATCRTKSILVYLAGRETDHDKCYWFWWVVRVILAYWLTLRVLTIDSEYLQLRNMRCIVQVECVGSGFDVIDITTYGDNASRTQPVVDRGCVLVVGWFRMGRGFCFCDKSGRQK